MNNSHPSAIAVYGSVVDNIFKARLFDSIKVFDRIPKMVQLFQHGRH